MNETATRRRIPPTPQRARGTSAWLRVVHAPDSAEIDRLIPVRANGLELGRKPADGVAIADPLASRRHFVVSCRGATAVVEDLGSANGTRLDGNELAPNVPTPLHDGAVIRMGDTIMLWLTEDPTPSRGAEGLGMFGRAPSVEAVRRKVRLLGPSDLPVLVCGPTGAGQELVAHALHPTSRRDGELVAVNCPALPGSLAEDALFGHVRGAFTGASGDHDGAFVRADRGTLFLDEVGDMSAEVQPKLLRALETGVIAPIGGSRTRQVNVRVVAATNVDLPATVADGGFREDLLARLAGATILLPPLAARRDDILPLFRRFLGHAARGRTADAGFVEALLLRPWRRNIRELRNLARRLEVLFPDATTWTVDMLDDMAPGSPGDPSGPTGPVAVASPTAAQLATAAATAHTPNGSGVVIDGPPDRETLVALIERFDGNLSDVARHVGRSRKQIYRWLKRHGVDPQAARSG